MSATRMPYPSASPVYAAVERWRDRCLLDDLSLFSDERTAMLANGEELVRDFVEKPDMGGGDFLGKLAVQLKDSSPGAVQLAAELLYVHLLVARSEAVGGSKKRTIVNRVLGFASGTAPMPVELADALDAGLVRPGTAYGTYRWGLFAYLIRVFVALKRLPAAERNQILRDPDALVNLLDGIDGSNGGDIQKYALQHLLLPDEFAPVISREARAKILERWPRTGLVASEPRRLASVYRELASSTGSPESFVNLWRSPWVWQWQSPSDAWVAAGEWMAWWARRVDLDREERDYKVALSGRLVALQSLVMDDDASWPAELIRVLRSKEHNLLDFRTIEEVVSWVRADPDGVRTRLLALWKDPTPDALTTFQRSLPVGVLDQQGKRLSVSSVLHMAGRVESQPPWRAQYLADFYALASYHRPEPTAPDGEAYDVFLSILDLVQEAAVHHDVKLRDRLDAQGLLYTIMSSGPPEGATADVTAAISEFHKRKPVGPPSAPAPPPSEKDKDEIETEKGEDTGPDEALADLAARLYLDEEFLVTIRDLLTDRRQVIFTGNPGTGKTYVAREFATWFTGSRERVQLVQFHAAYSYEDFVEGYRPTETGGFTLRSGPLRRIAKKARRDPDHNYVLIIDELNRGNVARVFGELYFLLEYRTSEVRMMYSRKRFALPENLYLIGTMNSADRSIALMDSALRRRFSFVDFDPTAAPVATVLERFLKAQAPSQLWVAELVRRANETIADPLASIGPSHFLRRDLDEVRLARVWEHDVVPTLREHLYGRSDLLDRLTLDALRSSLTPEPDPGDGDDPAA